MFIRKLNKKMYVAALISVILLLFISDWTEKGYATEIRKVTLQRMYLDGEMSEETFVKEVGSVEQIIRDYRNWQLVMNNDKELIFQKYINDISPLLKTNGYFGITDDGTLSIYNGKPIDSDVIQSFFHIDVEMLETKKHNELVKGIRVKNKKQYKKVLEVFQQYIE